MGKRASKDIGWVHCSKVDGNPNRVCCNYCGHHMFGITRLKEHLAHFGTDVIPCPTCPEEFKSQMEELLLQRGIHMREKKKKRGRALVDEDVDLVEDEDKGFKTLEMEKKKAATEDELEAACHKSACIAGREELIRRGEGCSEPKLASFPVKDDEIDLNVATDFDSERNTDLGF